MTNNTNNTNDNVILTAVQKRAATIEAKNILAEQTALEEIQAAQEIEQQERIAAFEKLEALNALKAMSIDEESANFKTLENVDNFRVGIDLARAALALAEPVTANQIITQEKARLTMINRANRDKRFKKINGLSNDAISLIVANSTPDIIETTAIYAVDKIVQTARFLSGDSAVFGRGKNNSLMYLIRGIAVHAPQMITRDFAVNALTRYGQPHESADTQASSSCKALLALDCLFMTAPGKYTINHKSALMTLLLAEYSN